MSSFTFKQNKTKKRLHPSTGPSSVPSNRLDKHGFGVSSAGRSRTSSPSHSSSSSEQNPLPYPLISTAATAALATHAGALSTSSLVKSRAQNLINEALEQDPNIFAYDEADSDEEDGRKNHAGGSRRANENVIGVQGPSRYISSLVRKAKEREIERERVEERRIQKEREEEQREGLYDDKEKFITDAYKQKLQEMEKLEKAEKEKERLERDKKHDVNAFYANMLQNVDKKQQNIDPNHQREKLEKDYKATYLVSKDDHDGNCGERIHSLDSRADPQQKEVYQEYLRQLREKRQEEKRLEQEQRLEKRKARAARRNTAEQIELARQRYFQRLNCGGNTHITGNAIATEKKLK